MRCVDAAETPGADGRIYPRRVEAEKLAGGGERSELYRRTTIELVGGRDGPVVGVGTQAQSYFGGAQIEHPRLLERGPHPVHFHQVLDHRPLRCGENSELHVVILIVPEPQPALLVFPAAGGRVEQRRLEDRNLIGRGDADGQSVVLRIVRREHDAFCGGHVERTCTSRIHCEFLRYVAGAVRRFVNVSEAGSDAVGIENPAAVTVEVEFIG